MAAILITGLSQVAKDYDSQLRTLPFLVLGDKLKKLGVNLLEIGDAVDTRITHERVGGLVKPYNVASLQTLDADERELGRFVETDLVPQKAYCAIRDNIENYTTVKNILNADKEVDNKTKKHPLEMMILENIVRTVGEDQIDAMFHSKRDNADASPLGISNGFYTLMDGYVTGGAIVAGKGNYRESGALTAPANGTDTVAFTRLVAWLRGADPQLSNQNLMLYIPLPTLRNVRDAAANKFQYITMQNGTAALQELLRDHADMPNLNIVSDPALGSGTRIVLTVARNLDYGISKGGANQFVQIRQPYSNPNWFQGWLQFNLGQRINSIHRKMFYMNEGNTASTALSGDYRP